MTKKILLLLFVVAAVGAATAWPRLSDVETGRTPEYPDLQVHEYDARPEDVVKAVKGVLARLPRWALVGSGSGPAGSAMAATHTTRVFRFKDDVNMRVWHEGGKTKVSVRSRSRIGGWDFGQNARNIRELLAALDSELS